MFSFWSSALYPLLILTLHPLHFTQPLTMHQNYIVNAGCPLHCWIGSQGLCNTGEQGASSLKMGDRCIVYAGADRYLNSIPMPSIQTLTPFLYIWLFLR